MLSGRAGILCMTPPSCSPARRYKARCWRGCLQAAVLLRLQANCCKLSAYLHPPQSCRQTVLPCLQVVCRIFDMPVGGVTLMDSTETVLDNMHGMEGKCARDQTFCRHLLASDYPQVVMIEDARQHWRWVPAVISVVRRMDAWPGKLDPLLAGMTSWYGKKGSSVHGQSVCLVGARTLCMRVSGCISALLTHGHTLAGSPMCLSHACRLCLALLLSGA